MLAVAKMHASLHDHTLDYDIRGAHHGWPRRLEWDYSFATTGDSQDVSDRRLLMLSNSGRLRADDKWALGFFFR